MRYVLLFVETEEFARELAARDPEERARTFALVGKWFEDHADRISHRGNKLQDGHTATTVRLGRGDEPLITDGPFVEGKEVVSGYCEVDVADLDEALRMVRTWPGCSVVEIRPVQESPMPPTRPAP